jgi:hypothetical protein
MSNLPLNQPPVTTPYNTSADLVNANALQAGVADSPTGTDSSSSGSGSSSELLSQRVKGNGQLITGQLSNGLRYVLLPNRTPPQRFEAHLEVHAGSVDEREHEQVRVYVWMICCMWVACVLHLGRGADDDVDAEWVT